MTFLVQVMEKTLSKLATFDEGSMMGSMLGFVVSITTLMMMMVMVKYQLQHFGHIFTKLTCHLAEQENQRDWVWN